MATTHGASAPIEKKVTAATVGAALTQIVLYLLAKVDFVEDMNDGVKAAVGILVTALVTFLAGYMARHTHRPDLAGGAVGGSGPVTPL